MKKLTLLVAGVAGYVLGTRAGRERYDQIKKAASRTWESAPVQGAKETVEEQARSAAADVGHRVADAAGTAATTAKDKVASTLHRSDDEPTTVDDVTLVGRGTA